VRTSIPGPRRNQQRKIAKLIEHTVNFVNRLTPDLISEGEPPESDSPLSTQIHLWRVARMQRKQPHDFKIISGYRTTVLQHLVEQMPVSVPTRKPSGSSRPFSRQTQLSTPNELLIRLSERQKAANMQLRPRPMSQDFSQEIAVFKPPAERLLEQHMQN